jgi:hypothetical protein
MKKKLIIGVVFILLLVLAVFGRKKSINVSIGNPIAQIQQPEPAPEAASDQPDRNVPAEKTDPASAPKNETKNLPAAAAPVAGKIVDRFIFWGFQKASGRKIDTIILHSSYDALGSDPFSVSGVIAEFKQYDVSAHYLIGRDGATYHLVADQNIAWHAGVSKMPDGRTGVNAFSIGIEMINTLDGKFTDAQYSVLNSLIATLKKQYPIKYILGHSDIAPGRKTDPWGIEWGKVVK